MNNHTQELLVGGREYSIILDTVEQWNADNIESMTEAQALKLVDSLPAELYHPIAHAIELLRIDTPKPKPKRANCNEACN